VISRPLAKNPKDAVGAGKVPMSIVPSSAIEACALALHEGRCKYGNANWRRAPVRVSIYLDALQRHVASWTDGEQSDPSTGVPHLGSAIACLAIIVDAHASGTLIDDRPPSQATGDRIRGLASAVARITKAFEGSVPAPLTRSPVEWADLPGYDAPDDLERGGLGGPGGLGE